MLLVSPFGMTRSVPLTLDFLHHRSLAFPVAVDADEYGPSRNSHERVHDASVEDVKDRKPHRRTEKGLSHGSSHGHIGGKLKKKELISTWDAFYELQ